MGRPEPGVDVFAEQAGKAQFNDAKSSAIDAHYAKEKEQKEEAAAKIEKEISQVGAPSTKEAVEAPQSVVAEEKKDEKKDEKKAETKVEEKKDAKPAAEAKPAEEKKEEPPTLKKPAGPLDEVEVEAAKVAEELYPEAAAV